MAELTKRSWMSKWGVIIILILQIGLFSIRLNDPFIDGRFHLNWGPPFWLMHAKEMHKANFVRSYLGAVTEVVQTPNGPRADSWYSSHPQLIAIPLYLWTGLFGFAEWVIRSLGAVLMLCSTLLFWFAVRYRHTTKQAMLFLLFWATLPVIINFGVKLDQEQVVIACLALAFLGHERFAVGREKFPWTWGVACALLLWADWSGFIFVALFFLALLAVQRVHSESRKLVHATIGGGVLGLGIVFVQTFLEMRSSKNEFYSFVGLYKYRSNSTENGFWYAWLQKQIAFYNLNFGGVLGAVGLFGIFAANISAVKRRLFTFNNGLTFASLTLLVGIGTLVYALAVPQATAIHLYYQIFYSIPVAYGLLLVVEWLERFLKKQNQQVGIAGVLIVAALVWGAYCGIRNLNLDKEGGWGTPAEIEILKYVGTLPAGATVTFLGSKDFSAWLDNPNIRYYAGRAIPIVADPHLVATSTWVMFGFPAPSQVDVAVTELNKFAEKGYEFHPVKCSPLLCLAQRGKK